MGIFFFLSVHVVEASGLWYAEAKYRDIVLGVGATGIKEEVNTYLSLSYTDYQLFIFIPLLQLVSIYPIPSIYIGIAYDD